VADGGLTSRIEDTFDFRSPDYVAVFRARAQRLQRLRESPQSLPHLKAWYREHIADFVSDWGMTYDPRGVSRTQPAYLPFILQPKQRELVEWIIERWRAASGGLVEKSRDVGASWIAMATSVALCVLYPGITIGFGSATELKLDRSGDPDSLFWKGRLFVENLPWVFRGGCDISVHAPDKRLLFPFTGSSITGEVGDTIGRSGRKAIYFVDEAAFIQHPKLIESALSGNTDCRIDISSASIEGEANDFAIRRQSGQHKVFTLHYRDDLRKDDAWRAKKQATLDPIVWAADYEINYAAATEGAVIPALWRDAAVGAAEKLGYVPSGCKRLGLDVADEGADLNCAAGRHGSLLDFLESWTGKNSDTFKTAARAVSICEGGRYEGIDYDADGLGAFVRGDVNRINEDRVNEGKEPILIEPFRGSASGEGLYDPDGEMVEGRINREYFANLKAQSWMAFRERFRNTYRAVIEGIAVDLDACIFIPRDLPELAELLLELARPTYSINTAGKLLVNKMPDGMKSPNRADAVMIAFNPTAGALRIWAALGKAA
jgi:phage terminase large subunit